MKILFLAHSFPYPPDEGIKLGSYNLLKEFSKRNEIILLTFINKEEKKYINKIKDYCKIVEVIEHNIPRNIFKRTYNIFFQKKPFFVFQFFSKELVEKLQKLVDKEKPDIVHLDFIDTIMYRNFIPQNMLCLFFPHDAFSMYLYRNISAEKNLFRRFYTYFQYKRTVVYEKEMLPKFEKTVVVSPKDKEWLLNLNPNLDISVIPYGVDTEYFKPTNAEDYPSVIFRGIMNFLPNVDAALYFAKKVLPFIRKEIPDVKYYVVGKNPTREVKQLAPDPLNIITGYVEDIRPYIGKSIVNVCPMRIGSGIKNKILEAMAMEKPTVATSVACEGIPEVKDGENILIADTPEEFAKKTILLINNESLRKKIGKNARQFVMKNYTWANTAYQFEKVYQEAINQQRAGKPAPTRRGDLGRPIAL